MLKALKTLLKDDIINPNTKGGFIMGVQQALTTEQVSILLWLKAIDDFKGEGYETATFNEKYDAFEAVEDTGFTMESLMKISIHKNIQFQRKAKNYLSSWME